MTRRDVSMKEEPMIAEPKTGAEAEVERAAVVAYLKRYAADCRRFASRLLADTTQNKPEADRYDTSAQTLENAAQAIEAERHWR